MTRTVRPVRCLLLFSIVALIASWVFFAVFHLSNHNDHHNHKDKMNDVVPPASSPYCTSFYEQICFKESDGGRESVFVTTKRNNDALMANIINATLLYHSCLEYDTVNKPLMIDTHVYMKKAILEGLPFVIYFDVDKMLHKSEYVVSINYDGSFCQVSQTPFCGNVTGDKKEATSFTYLEGGGQDKVDASFGYYKLNSLCKYHKDDPESLKKECLHTWWIRTLQEKYGHNVTIQFSLPVEFLNELVEVSGQVNMNEVILNYYKREAKTKGMSFCFYVAKYLNLPHINHLFYEKTQVHGPALHNVVEGIRRQIRRMTRGSNWLSWHGVNEIDAKMDHLSIFFLGEQLPKRKVATKYELYHGIESFIKWCREKDRRQRDRLKRNNYHEDRLVEGFEEDPYETDFDIVNAWYKPTRNSITIPPGILRPPIFHGENEETNKRVNYVYLSSVLAHEIGHSIDVHGLMFDEFGHYRGSQNDGSDGYKGAFTEKDKRSFDGLTQCLEKDYGNPCNRSDYGEHTLGEDMADQIGVYVSHHYFKEELTGMCSEFADEKRNEKCLKAFFSDYATIWCSNLTETQKCRRVNGDVHALPADRVDKTLRQIKAFSKVYKCKDEDFMVDKGQCLIY